MRPGILTLTTDFGPDGHYVAAMKGVILGLAPDAKMIDVSHGIAPQNILEGAFVLAGIVDTFPRETVHLAVIDPGVGTERRMIAARIAEQWFVLPDNGLLSGALHNRTPEGVWEITNPAIRRRTVSPTFHGRDIMAPAAAHLLLGGDPNLLGAERSRVIKLANFEPRSDAQGVLGEVIFRDRFGNLITNVRAGLLEGTPAEDWTVEIAEARVHGLSRTYGDRPAGTLVALAGSSGWIEVAQVNGDAARHLTAGPGMTVWFRKKINH